ncbi:hypothetical protein DFH09DRAFT_848291, partial [Mycena vulgaris]
STSSLHPSINNWLTGMCSVGFTACSPQTLGHVATNVSAGCGTLPEFEPNAAIPRANLTREYPVIRDVMCLKKWANNKFCMTELLTKYNAITQLSLTDPTVLLQDFTFGLFNLDCNECTKATFQLLAPLSDGESSTALITAVCGANFT